jgi:ubiquitin-like 1-activating enzyme E1 A
MADTTNGELESKNVPTDGVPANIDVPIADSSISAEEIALYDRQIRLWGVQAQENLRKANILLVSMKALANEVAKNLVLAGIRSLTIIDHHTVTEEDLGAQFFLTQEDIGKNVSCWFPPECLHTFTD